MAFPRQKDIEIPLLKALIEAGGRATPKEAVERVAKDFPTLTLEDLAMKQPSGSDLKWPNMVAWVRNTLCEKGAIDRAVRGTWVITATGRQMVADMELTLLRDEDSRQTRPVISIQNTLSYQLRMTANSGQDPTAFEEALAGAFRVLGFDAIKIGGRGDTDIRVTAPLGKQQYIAIVDAKSSRTGKVPDTALHDASLHDHREKHQADYVMVVAPGFSRGNTLTHAEREHVVLMEVESFLAILEMHEHTPLSLYTLRNMFIRPGLYGAPPRVAGIFVQKYTLSWKPRCCGNIQPKSSQFSTPSSMHHGP
jgi:Mrr N-terminal domain/Restriction endonuclease